MKVTDFSFMLINLETQTSVKSRGTQRLVQTARGPRLPIVDKKAVPVYLVLQGEVEGKIFDPFAVVDLHLRGVLVGLEVLDDIREPDRQAVVPGADSDVRGGRWSYILKIGTSNTGRDGR